MVGEGYGWGCDVWDWGLGYEGMRNEKRYECDGWGRWIRNVEGNRNRNNERKLKEEWRGGWNWEEYYRKYR